MRRVRRFRVRVRVRVRVRFRMRVRVRLRVRVWVWVRERVGVSETRMCAVSCEGRGEKYVFFFQMPHFSLHSVFLCKIYFFFK